MITNPKKILLIDDDSISVLHTSEMLKQMNIFEKIEILSNKEETVNYFEQSIATNGNLPGIILMDIMMPEFDGFDLIEEIEYLFEDAEIDYNPKVFMLSGTTYKRNFEKCENNPSIIQLLKKPLNPEEFKKALAND